MNSCGRHQRLVTAWPATICWPAALQVKCCFNLKHHLPLGDCQCRPVNCQSLIQTSCDNHSVLSTLFDSDAVAVATTGWRQDENKQNGNARIFMR